MMSTNRLAQSADSNQNKALGTLKWITISTPGLVEFGCP